MGLSTTARRPGRFVPGLQALRAFAALLVVVVHIPGSFLHSDRNIVPDLQPLAVGVDIFFVISGFVMMHVETGDGLGCACGFLARRVRRVVPLYWILTTIAVATYIQSHWSNGIHLSEIRRFVASYLFWPHMNSPGNKGDFAPMYQVGWTLNFEAFFYVLFALGMIVRRKILVVSAVLFSIILTGQFYDLDVPWYVWEDPIVLEFLAGMILAKIFGKVTVGEPLVWFGALSSVLLFGIGYEQQGNVTDVLFPYHRLGHFLTWGIPSTLLVWCVVNSRVDYGNRVGAIILFLGSASYSIYLMHPLVLDLLAPRVLWIVDTLGDGGGAIVASLILSCGSVAVGALTYRFVERPLHRQLGGGLRGPSEPSRGHRTISS